MIIVGFMKGSNGRKGFMYILEVLIAIGIMMSAIIFVFGSAPELPEFSSVIIGQAGIDALKYMENRGLLRGYVHENNEPLLESALAPLLSENIAFETEICTTTCDPTNVTGTRTTVMFDYFISGYRDSYVGKRVRIWLWERF